MQAAEQNPEFNRIKLIYVLLLVLIAVCILSGCTPSIQKALDKVTETEGNAKLGQYAIHGTYPNVTAAFSASVYPVQESTDTETTIESGNVKEFQTRAQLAEAKADSLLEALNSLPVKPECTDEASDRDKVIYALQQQLKGLNQQAKELKADTKTTVTNVVKESTAKIDDMQHKLTQLKAELLAEKQAHLKTLEQLDKVKGQRNTLLYIVGGIVALIILAGLRFLRII